MTHLNYHHLYYFKVIATEGSISRASQKLRLGQPALSMQLKQFEEHLGHPLFERKNRTLVLTEMGHLVLHYANEIFKLGDELMDAVHDRPSLHKLRVQIGVLPSVSKSIVKEIMNFAYSITECQIKVVEGDGRDLVEELINHRLDLVISNIPAPVLSTHKLYAKSFAKFPLIVCGAEKYLSKAQDFPKSLSGMPFILPTAHSQTRQEIDYFFEKTKLIVNVIAEVQDTSLMKTLAFDGKGMIFTSPQSVSTHLENKTLYKIAEIEDAYEELYLISAERKVQNPVADTLLKEFLYKPNGN